MIWSKAKSENWQRETSSSKKCCPAAILVSLAQVAPAVAAAPGGVPPVLSPRGSASLLLGPLLALAYDGLLLLAHAARVGLASAVPI